MTGIKLTDITDDMVRQIYANMFLDADLHRASLSEDSDQGARAFAVAVLRMAAKHPSLVKLPQTLDEAINQFFERAAE